jgi:hypothetical protein
MRRRFPCSITYIPKGPLPVKLLLANMLPWSVCHPCVKSSCFRLFAPSGDAAFCQAQSMIAICLPSPVRMTLELTLESFLDNLGTSIFNKPKSLSLAR